MACGVFVLRLMVFRLKMPYARILHFIQQVLCKKKTNEINDMKLFGVIHSPILSTSSSSFYLPLCTVSVQRMHHLCPNDKFIDTN
jgi:hypothetical protein